MIEAEIAVKLHPLNCIKYEVNESGTKIKVFYQIDDGPKFYLAEVSDVMHPEEICRAICFTWDRACFEQRRLAANYPWDKKAKDPK